MMQYFNLAPRRFRVLLGCATALIGWASIELAAAQTMPPSAKDAANPPTIGQPPAAKPAAPAPAPPPVTTNDVTLNLIHLLVQQKIITAKQADTLFQQAQLQAGVGAPKPRTASAAPSQSPAQSPTQSAAPEMLSLAPSTPAPSPAPTVHVTYVPEIIREEIKEQAKKELIAAGELPPVQSTLPDWLDRIKFDGDFRLRYERLLYDGSNSNLFINFNQLAASSTPFDISQNQTSFPPLENTTEDRTRFRVRARFGLTDNVNDDLTVAIRLSTGTDTNPVSPNETLGADFNKYDATFDRAYVDYHPVPWGAARAGRFPNPWFGTDLVWYSDLNFDGAAIQLGQDVTPEVHPFFTAGAFPVENTALDFPTNQEAKVASRDKWLFGAQLGASWVPAKDYLVKGGVTYYDYVNIEGQTSSPCLAVMASVTCNTDNSRPGFAQLGNTFYGIRDIVVPPTSIQPSEYQYFGLATPFHILDIAGRFDVAKFAPVHVILDGEFAMNLAYNRQAIEAKDPVNNLDSNSHFAGGNTAYIAKLTVGYPDITQWGDWNVSGAYKYLESDSIVDAFTDPDFHEGGTNAKGFIVTANLGIARDTWLTARYLSATEVSGPPLAVDVIQVDLNAKF